MKPTDSTPNPQSVCAKRGEPRTSYIHAPDFSDRAHVFEPSEPASLNAPAGTEEKHEEAKKDVAQDKEENQPRNETTLETAQTRSSVLAISPAPQPVAGEGPQWNWQDLYQRTEDVLLALRVELGGKNYKTNALDHIASIRYLLKGKAPEVTPKLEEIAAKLADGLTAWREGKGFEDCIGTRDLFAAILRPVIAPASTGAANGFRECARDIAKGFGGTEQQIESREAWIYSMFNSHNLLPPAPSAPQAATPTESVREGQQDFTESLRKLADWLKSWELIEGSPENQALHIAIDQLFDPEENGEILKLLASPSVPLLDVEKGTK